MFRNSSIQEKRISEFKKDMDYELETYNRINKNTFRQTNKNSSVHDVT